MANSRELAELKSKSKFLSNFSSCSFVPPKLGAITGIFKDRDSDTVLPNPSGGIEEFITISHSK